MTTPARILIVDDEHDLLETMHILLEQEKIDVTTAASGAAAVEALRRNRFDLVVTDLKMPGMSGAETITALHAIDPDLPVIVATAYASEQAAAECQKRGVRAVIQKPFSFQDFVTLVKQMLQ